MGPLRDRRAYDLSRVCGKGLLPFDRDAGLTTRDLTPAWKRVATLAGAHAVCHLRALYRSEKGQWDAFWNQASWSN